MKLGLGIRKFGIVAAVGVAVALPATPGHANDAIINLMGDVIREGMRQNRTNSAPPPRNTARPAPVWSAARQQRAAVQAALNDFGIPVG